MADVTLYAVLTGDVVGSSKLNVVHRQQMTSVLRSTFEMMREMLPDGIRAPFEIHRGDSFQGVLSKPEASLRIALAIRANLRQGMDLRSRCHIDARIAIGIGTIDSLPGGRVTEGDGEAFRRSGITLDTMKAERRLLLRTPWPAIDAELDTEMALLDALIQGWSPRQAQMIASQILGLRQKEAAQKFGLTQPTVQRHLKKAGSWAIEKLLSRFEGAIGGAQEQVS